MSVESQSLQTIWDIASSDNIDLSSSGKIVDYLDPKKNRADTAEERVRQSYARVLVEEYHYPKEWLAFECPISIGSQTKEADIVIYDSAESRAHRDQGRVLLIVETKEPSETKGRGQLLSYVFSSSAGGGVWTNGGSPSYFRRLERPHQQLKTWTNIPRYGETWDTVGQYRKTDLQPPKNLKQVFRRCHNSIYRRGLDSEDVALDMVRIILAKYKDEQNVGDLCQFRCTPEEYQNSQGKKQASDRVRNLFSDVMAEHPDVFAAGEEITIGDDGLATVICEFQPFRFLADEETEEVYDIIGTAFEVYVATHLKGSRGQYFTNRLVTNMLVEMMAPSETEVILDPAAGSGGFLIACLRYIRHSIMTSQRSPVSKGRALKVASERIHGIDISLKLVRVAKTNMILNGDGNGGLVQGDSLQSLNELPTSFKLRPGPSSQKPTLILTNPPFGASHELRVRDIDVLERFHLGHVWSAGEDGWLSETDVINSGEGVPPEILFIERAVEMLAPGGRLGIVIARGMLDNRDALAARQYVVRNTRILGIINCHPNTFAPFNGTKASILILEKKANPGIQRDENYQVFMAVSQRVGQDSQGREIYKKNDSGEWLIQDGQKVQDHDASEIATAWRQFRSGQAIAYESAWTIPLSRLLDGSDMRFNPTRFAPQAEHALARVLELAGTVDWSVERLGDFSTVFNGPRFKRPFANEGVVSGDDIVRMYTPKAFFEERGESAKFLDTKAASPVQRRALEVLTLRRDWILIVDSGTAGKLLGRVGMTSSIHENTVGNNNLIRIVIEDDILRSYVYQFLRSQLGQALLVRNVYGTNQDHIEPDDVKNIPIPIPRDLGKLKSIGADVAEVIALREKASELDAQATGSLDDLFIRAFAFSEE
ncbi:MAG: N-6 DNA methylase [Thermomicrobiales bacterium]